MSDMYAREVSRLAPGTRLNGIFEIDQRIASGGMGEIYRGHAIETGDPVAIKVMRTDLADNAMALALFRKEASALHYIHHEAIVRYYIFSNDPGTGRHYLAMEFVDGQPLAELLQQGPLGFEAVRLLQERLAAGLNAAHQHGIIHRDLSPDNVLIPGGDLARAKIIDFGIARSTRVGDGTIIGSGFAGKYNYVSPEQLGLYGGDVTAKSDIYSLGLVLAQCLTGRPIDMGGTQFEVLEKRRVVPDLSAIDRRFRPLLEKMLQPNPADRPDSMAAVAAWRPKPATRPPLRITAARDRGQAAGKTAPGATKPKSMLGRRLAQAAVAAAVLLVVGTVVFYSAKDFDVGSAPNVLPKPPDLDPALAKQREEEAKRRAEEQAKQNQAAVGPVPVFPSERLSTDPRQRIIDFINAYDGGDCFFIAPEAVEEGKATLDGLGSSVAPFEVFDYEFKRQLAFEASIGVHQVMPAQCPAVSFLFRIRNQPGRAPRLDIATSRMPESLKVTGTISEFGDRYVQPLLVSDDGRVSNVALQPSQDSKSRTFSFRIRKDDPGPPRPQLLIAIASSKQLDALKLPPDGAPAEQVFSLLADALRTGQTLNVSAKYFMLEYIKPP